MAARTPRPMTQRPSPHANQNSDNRRILREAVSAVHIPHRQVPSKRDSRGPNILAVQDSPDHGQGAHGNAEESLLVCGLNSTSVAQHPQQQRRFPFSSGMKQRQTRTGHWCGPAMAGSTSTLELSRATQLAAPPICVPCRPGGHHTVSFLAVSGTATSWTNTLDT